MSDDLHRERVEAHRELQFLRAAAWRPKKGQGRRKRQWVAERARKLDEVKRAKP